MHLLQCVCEGEEEHMCIDCFSSDLLNVQLNVLINGTDAKLSFVHKCVLGTASLLGLSEVICAVQKEIKKPILIDISDKLF